VSCGRPEAGGGIGGTGNTATVVSGSITNTSPNNVSVSGSDYNTSSTVITVDGKSGHHSDLKKGMVVLVNATVAHTYGTNAPPQRTANTLLYEDTVEGVVQTVAPDGSSLVVLGQTGAITTTTIIDASIPGQDILSLVPGRDLVELSGFITGDGIIVATLIALKFGPPDYEVKGFIKNYDAAHGTFEIGAVTVDFQNADVSAMPNAASNTWNGLLVDVRGSHVSPGGPGAYAVQLTATKIKPEGLGIGNSDEAEIEGFVTLMFGQSDFYLGNVHVQTTAATIFKRGTLDDILLGSHLKVKGALVGGIVQATRVGFEGEMDLEGNVATINPTDNTLTLIGLAGLVIQFDSQTALQGQGNPLLLTDLRSDDHLHIHGPPRGENAVLATRVLRNAPNPNVQLQGLVTMAADPILVLQGASIDTSSIAESGFKGANGVKGRSAFFIGLSSGMTVSLGGTVLGDTIAWSSAARDD
ncbi:MAG TPA: DUF5666 domain-containing protein, partial [Nitrospiraceae bacterium]|nr:DUF5666 domain-containing protein [Nitrospiraceae bacterium]